jgi:hypothetical protein
MECDTGMLNRLVSVIFTIRPLLTSTSDRIWSQHLQADKVLDCRASSLSHYFGDRIRWRPLR